MSGGYVNPWWQAILLPEKWDVCGIEVRTMSVWHLYALENLNNAYVCGGATDRDSAASLLLICQRDMAETRELFLRPRARAKALTKIHKLILPLKWDEINAACTDYCLTCMRVPEHLRSVDGSGKYLKAPTQWHIVLCLCERYQMTVEQAWNHPYADARCKFDVYQESQGNESLASETIQRHTDEALEKKFTEKK
jgi:hypothetical protein